MSTSHPSTSSNSLHPSTSSTPWNHTLHNLTDSNANQRLDSRCQTPGPSMLQQPQHKIFGFLHLQQQSQPFQPPNAQETEVVKDKGKARVKNTIQSIRSAISLRSILTIPISINPFSSPETSPASRTNSWPTRFLGSTFASQDGEGASPSPVVTDGPRVRFRTRSRHPSSPTRSGRRILGLRPVTLFWGFLVLAQTGLMSLCVSIGVVTTNLKRGIAIAVVAWLIASALVAVGGMMGALVVFAMAQNRRKRSVEVRGPMGVEEARLEGGGEEMVIPVSRQDEPGQAAVVEKAKVVQKNEKSTAEDYSYGDTQTFPKEPRSWDNTHPISSNARQRREDDGILMMRSAHHRNRSLPILRVETRVASAQGEEESTSADGLRHRSWKELQDIIERDTNQYVQGHGRSGISAAVPAEGQASTSKPAETVPTQRSGGFVVGPSVVQSPEQEQAYLELRRQHFAAVNRNHFLGLDHGVLDRMAPQTGRGGGIWDRRLSSM